MLRFDGDEATQPPVVVVIEEVLDDSSLAKAGEAVQPQRFGERFPDAFDRSSVVVGHLLIREEDPYVAQQLLVVAQGHTQPGQDATFVARDDERLGPRGQVITPEVLHRLLAGGLVHDGVPTHPVGLPVMRAVHDRLLVLVLEHHRPLDVPAERVHDLLQQRDVHVVHSATSRPR